MLQGNGRVHLWFRKRNQKASRWTVVLLSSRRDKHLNIFRNYRDFLAVQQSRASTARDAGSIPGWVIRYHMTRDEAKKKKKRIKIIFKKSRKTLQAPQVIVITRSSAVFLQAKTCILNDTKYFQIMETICGFFFLSLCKVFSICCCCC